MSNIIGHSFRISLICVVTTFIVMLIYYLMLWYRIPHKYINYNAQVIGCLGPTPCNILLGMDYGDGFRIADNEKLGAFIFIKHPFRKHSPFLFRGDIDYGGCSRKRSEHYHKLYFPLAKYDIKRCEEISTVYRTSIRMTSNLYDYARIEDDETWKDKSMLLIRKLKSRKETANTVNAESWFYLHRLSERSVYDSGSVVLEGSLTNTFDNYRPSYKSKGDISKLDTHIKIDLHGWLICDTVLISTVGPCDLKSVSVIPDSVSFSKIYYYTRDKIETIKKCGLDLYAEFPEAQKLQNIRIAVLLFLIPLVITILFKTIQHEIRSVKDSLPKQL